MRGVVFNEYIKLKPWKARWGKHNSGRKLKLTRVLLNSEIYCVKNPSNYNSKSDSRAKQLLYQSKPFNAGSIKLEPTRKKVGNRETTMAELFLCPTVKRVLRLSEVDICSMEQCCHLQ